MAIPPSTKLLGILAMNVMKRNGFYVIEGDNGTGKTTTLTRLSSSLDIFPIATPTKRYKALREIIHEIGNNNISFLFYMLGNYDAELVIRKKLKNQSVVCDRYVVSTFVDFMIREELGFEEVSFMYNFFSSRMLMPDITFLLKCEHDKRVKRVIDRPTLVSARDDLSKKYSDETNYFYNEFIKKGLGRWHIIDTTYKQEQDVSHEVMEVIRSDLY